MKILDFGEERRLAADMADQLAKQLAPVLMEKRRHVLSANRVARLLEQTIATAKERQAKTGMGVMRRAYLAREFKSALEAKGYPEDFVSVAVEGLLVELSRKPSKPSKD